MVIESGLAPPPAIRRTRADKVIDMKRREFTTLLGGDIDRARRRVSRVEV
jgi:hypothetical protein